MKGWIVALALGAVIIVGCSSSTPGEPEARNQPPVIQQLKVSSLTIRVGTECILTCEAVDPDHDELSYKWETTGLGYILGSGKSVTFTAASCCVGPNDIKVTVYDSKGASDSRQVTVNVIL
ncbi:MAG: hypothetical protein D6814_01495 [Calditrichaeota bacterium]|nr:MAG: hypothetical protein D6814_01495 [Calditrichota bacterium]